MEYIFSNKDNSVGLFLRDCRKMETWVKKAILRPHSHAERTSILEYFLTTVQVLFCVLDDASKNAN